MLISYSHNFLFQHIPKTAGCSVTEQLEPFGHRPETLPVNRMLERVGIRVNLVIGPYKWKRFRDHSDMETIRRVLPAQVFDSLYKFAFVRNPWDWLVSRYHYITQSPHHGQHERVKRLDGFAGYVRWQAARKKRGQADLLFSRDGELLLDYVGRFETLAEDFTEISRRVGIDTNLPARRNASRHADYRSYYDDATSNLVAERWAKEIAAFGYCFDGVAEETEFIRGECHRPRLAA